MQYESNPANGFRDIVQKRNTDDGRTAARPDMVMTISPAPTSWAGDKNDLAGVETIGQDVGSYKFFSLHSECR